MPMSNGGINNTGVFGFIGTTIQCKAEDTSFYCTFMKYFQLLMMFIFIILIIYFIYVIGKSYLGNKNK